MDKNEQLPQLKKALKALRDMRVKLDSLESAQREPIAIIGMGCRFPGGANSPEAYWQMLLDGVDAIREVPADRWPVDSFYSEDETAAGKMNSRWGGFLDEVDKFDPGFFGISPREARQMDPQQRLLLETAVEALERAGLPQEKLLGSKTGVFIGAHSHSSDYAVLQNQSIFGIDAHSSTGTAHSILANRLSYLFDWYGPSLTLDTACSSSLVSIHLGVNSLRTGESDTVLAAGVNLMLVPEVSVSFSKLQAISPDGRCKTFDSRANGFVRGEGCGVVIMKRLSDAQADGDPIIAVIRGSAVNQDGSTNGLTAPNGISQQSVIRQALANANVEPETISYIEAHGTGTILGDPIEVEALVNVLDQEADLTCYLGSTKTNIGHLEGAAGIAGIIRTALALQHGEIPPHLHFQELNPHISIEGTRFAIATERQTWNPDGLPRRAGVSSFGFGGTNAHIVLEEAPAPEEIPDEPHERPYEILTLSAKRQDSLRDLASQYANWLDTHKNVSLGDVCFTANARHDHYNYRLAVAADSTEAMQQKLSGFAAGEQPVGTTYGEPDPDEEVEIAFLFTGQGAQYVDMGRKLYETEPLFRKVLDQCADLLNSHLEHPLLDVLYPDLSDSANNADLEGLIDDTTYTQPALFAIEYALAQLWLSWGINPAVVMGHSVGEYVAACLAGVFSLEDGLKLIAARGRLMGKLPHNGTMAAVFTDEATVKKALAGNEDQVDIAAINGPTNIVISGEKTAVSTVCTALEEQGVKTRALTVSHAFHSPLMDPILAEFEEVATTVTYHTPKLLLLSNVTGLPADSQKVTTPAYWRDHVRASVRFYDTVRWLDEHDYKMFLEIGPAPTLSGMGKRCLPEGTHLWLPSMRQNKDNWQQILDSLGTLYTQGVRVDWEGFDQAYHRHCVSLPTYPFFRQSYWLKVSKHHHIMAALADGHPLLGQRVQSPVIEDIIFESTISTDTIPFLADHVIQNQVLVPSTAFLEMALSAAKEAFPEKTTAVTDMLIQRGLPLSEELCQIQTVLSQVSENSANCRIFSFDPVEDAWHLHTEGQLSFDVAKGDTSVQTTIAELKERCNREKSTIENYALLQQRGIDFGPTFRGVSQLWQGENEALGLIERPQAIIDADRYTVHPAVLDAGLQILLAAFPDDESTYVPVGIGRYQVIEPLPQRFYSHATLQPTEAAKTVKGNVDYFDENGRLLAQITDVTIQRLDDLAAQFSASRGQTDWKVQVNWQPQPHPVTIGSSQESTGWLVISHEDASENPLTNELQESGGDVRFFKAESLSPSPESWSAVWDSSQPPQGIIYLASEGFPQVAVQDVAAIKSIQQQIIEPILGLMPHITQLSAPPRLWLVTRGAQSISGEEPVAIAQRPLWGIAQSIDKEHPELRCTCIDLNAYPQVGEQEMLWAEIQADSNERLVALHNHERVVARLQPYQPVAKAIEPIHLTMPKRGQLTDLTLQPSARRQPGTGEVEIRVMATGMNFRDVLKALDMYPDPEIIFGDECSGVITAVGPDVDNFQPGDTVFGLATDSFGTYAIAKAGLLHAKPATLSFVDAATLPIAFITAHYALFRRGNLKAGERILIHAAAGGVGQAAVQLALRAGAEVWGTAGSPEKRAFLREMGVHHVLNSRTLDFADTIIEQTNGEGVDVILNSLNQDFIERNLAALADNGRFLEMGKIGIWDEEQVASVRPNAEYIIIFPDYLFRDHPDVIQAFLNDTTTGIEDGTLKPLPRQVFPITQIQDAFRFMAQARHIGKIVITQEADPSVLIREKIQPGGSYLITGGFSGIGLQTANWLAEQGAKHLVLIGRRGVTEEAAPILSGLSDKGVNITTLAADISQEADVSRVFDSINQAGVPLRGIIHSAGVNADGVLLQQDWNNFEKVFAPKLDGAWHLHNQTVSLSLDFFVMFSSIASLIGSAGQTNYAAANAFLDGLAQYRRTCGLPATSINWGVWDNIGMTAALSEQDRQRWQRMGLGVISVEQGMAQLGQMPTAGQAQIGVLPIDHKSFSDDNPLFTELIGQSAVPGQEKIAAIVSTGIMPKLNGATMNKRQTIMLEFVETETKQVLGLDDNYPLDERVALSDIGLDSLMAVELKNRLNSNLELKRPLPATLIFDYPTTSAISGFLLKNIALEDAEADSAEPESTETDEPSLLDDLESLSDDDVDKLFAEMGLSENLTDE